MAANNRARGRARSGNAGAGSRAPRKEDPKRSVRASQLVSPFGVGAIVELGGESFACMDVSRWPASACVPLEDNDLARRLNTEIRRPPSSEQGAAVPFSRFPRWLFCPSCRVLTHLTHTADEAAGFEPPSCQRSECRRTALVPMRFVAVCENGHLQDIDWHAWAHRDAQYSSTGQCKSSGSSVLKFLTSGASGGDFNAMQIACSCGAKHSFEGLTDRPYPFSCRGRQPWQSWGKETHCDALLRVHPRGASNVYYASQLSALDIGSDAIGQSLGSQAGIGCDVP